MSSPFEFSTRTQWRKGDKGDTGQSGPHLRFPPSDEQAQEEPERSTGAVLAADGVTKSYQRGSMEIPVLRGVEMKVFDGEFLAIIGQSGSGKTTLLHLLASLDQPDAGEIHFGGRRIDNLSPSERDHLRNHDFGMIFQFYHLLPELSALENVISPMLIRESVLGYWKNRRKYRDRAKSLLESVGLSHRSKHRPRELSGGEMQRTAIARALMSDPLLLFADEPTGNLDSATGREILHLLRTLNREHNLTIVMVTHDNSIARQADRIVRLSEGEVEYV